MKKRIVVICPGRGSYTKETLGYVSRYGKNQNEFIANIDGLRKNIQEPSITELDSAKVFKVSVHTKGEHASPLIYACSYVDFQNIDRDKYEIVAVCGNSMGWYLALAFAKVLNWENSFNLIQTMGSMMKESLIGGQIIYPIVKDDWTLDLKLREKVDELIKRFNCHLSIRLGGYYVIAGETSDLKKLMDELPKSGDYPFQLINHGAFHTPLMSDISRRAFEFIDRNGFKAPDTSLVDGSGKIWRPLSTNIDDLYEYTLGTQVTDTYDFTLSLEVALKEFAPEHLVLLGPGASLGGAIGQTLVGLKWSGINSKMEFQAQQKDKFPLLAMGLDDQREKLVTE